MSQTAQIAAGDRGDAETAMRCPICDQRLSATDVHGGHRLITVDGQFTVIECADCEYGVTLPQLSEEALARYYPSEYFDFWGYSGQPPNNPLQRLLARFRSWSA